MLRGSLPVLSLLGYGHPDLIPYFFFGFEFFLSQPSRAAPVFCTPLPFSSAVNLFLGIPVSYWPCWPAVFWDSRFFVYLQVICRCEQSLISPVIDILEVFLRIFRVTEYHVSSICHFGSACTAASWGPWCPWCPWCLSTHVVFSSRWN